MPTFEVFYVVCKTAGISLVSKSLTQKGSHGVQVELLHHHIKLYPDQIKSVKENEANLFCFALTLRPQARSRSVKVV